LRLYSLAEKPANALLDGVGFSRPWARDEPYLLRRVVRGCTLGNFCGLNLLGCYRHEG
jgi:hypothetical protein